MTEYILSFNLIEFIVRSKSILILNCKALVYVYKKNRDQGHLVGKTPQKQ